MVYHAEERSSAGEGEDFGGDCCPLRKARMNGRRTSFDHDRLANGLRESGIRPGTDRGLVGGQTSWTAVRTIAQEGGVGGCVVRREATNR